MRSKLDLRVDLKNGAGHHDQISIIFRPRRYRLSTISYRHARADAFGLRDGYAVEMTA